MNKKKILLSVAATSMIAITGAVLAINGGLKNSSVFATNDVVWYHYAAVEPTPTRHGSREFWASSTDKCATHQFVNPGVASIDRNFLDNEYFYSLTNEDDRYIAPTSSSPIINGNTVTYGIYPQTVLTDEELVSNLDNDATEQTNGWFLYRGEYYAKVSATPYDSDYTFDNGTTIVEDTTYWFKCEPITWNVLPNTNGEYILSSVLLDVHCYYDFESAGYEYDEYRTINNKKVYRNNYEYSDIRSWLNNEFYNSAFALGKSHIQTTTVDNSASTTFSDENSYASEETTKDNVFLPSYKDYTNGSYGFSAPDNPDDARRCCKTTDWARARGAWYDTRYWPYNGDYWTRSPSSEEYDVVSSVAYTGWVKASEWKVVDQAWVCVRPALSIKIL